MCTILNNLFPYSMLDPIEFARSSFHVEKHQWKDFNADLHEGGRSAAKPDRVYNLKTKESRRKFIFSTIAHFLGN